MSGLQAAVGPGCPNRREDVKLVQSLLNDVPIARGGLGTKLVVDGLFGPRTGAAIRSFQQRHLGFSDGVVSPGKRTIAKLLELTGSDPSPQQEFAALNVALSFIENVRLIPILVDRPLELGPALPVLQKAANELRVVLGPIGNAPDRRTASLVAVAPAIPILGGAGAGAGGVGAVLTGPVGVAFVFVAGVAIMLHNRPVVLPKTEEEAQLEQQLSTLEELMFKLAVDQARKMQTQVRTIKTELEECGLKNFIDISPGGRCFDFNEAFKKLAQDLLRMLTHTLQIRHVSHRW
jgi:peptidoglycan hydrolase-like protein with peptidoglycan-binding domain